MGHQNTCQNYSCCSVPPSHPAPIVLPDISIGSKTVWLSQTGVQQREHTELNVLQPSIRQPGNAGRLISCQQTHRGAFRMTGLIGHDRNSWSCTVCSPQTVGGGRKGDTHHLEFRQKAWRLVELQHY